MISFEAFRQTDGTPIYLQIIRYIQQGLAPSRTATSCPPGGWCRRCWR